MRDLIAAKVAELDAKYPRVAIADIVSLDNDPFAFQKGVHEILRTRPSGSYRVALVYFPDPSDFVPEGLDDSVLDAEIDKADAVLSEVSGNCGWVVPEGDPLAKGDVVEDLLCLVLTAG